MAGKILLAGIVFSALFNTTEVGQLRGGIEFRLANFYFLIAGRSSLVIEDAF
jgi:hypothetical protein